MMIFRRNPTHIFVLAACCLAAFGVLPAPAAAAKDIEAKAAEVMNAFSEYLGGLKTFKVTIAFAMKMRGEGMKEEFSSASTLAVERPRKAAMRLESGSIGITMVCDGTKLHTYMPMIGQYTSADAPDKLSSVPAGRLGLGMGGFPLLQALLAENTSDRMLSGVHKADYLGTQVVDGTKCHHVRFEQEEFDWDAWVSVGKRPLLLKVEPDMSKMFQKAAESGRGRPGTPKDFRCEMAYTLSGWQTDVKLPADEFVFKPPEGANRTESFFPGVGAGKRKRRKHALIGRPAPPLKQDLLEGGRFDLASHKGKNIVVLGFWATWRSPSRKALPVLLEATAAFKDDGVVFVAVNENEAKEKIQAFLDAQDLTCTVALDPEGEAGKRYRVQALPQVAVIDKAGVTRAVHIGFLRDLKQVLEEEIKTLLRGQSDGSGTSE
jgi:peroxiredoxin